MKSVIVFALCVAVASAAVIPSEDPKSAIITEQHFENIGVGPYSHGYQTSDGKTASEEGILKNQGTDAEAIEVRGFYSFTGPDGILYQVNYLANEKGFQPEGAHLPKNQQI